MVMLLWRMGMSSSRKDTRLRKVRISQSQAQKLIILKKDIYVWDNGYKKVFLETGYYNISTRNLYATLLDYSLVCGK